MLLPLYKSPAFNRSSYNWWLPLGYSQVLGGVKAKINDFNHAVEEDKVVLYAA
ncbi:MAG: hypothetical protein HRU34_02885 [Richelia sp.]|nr:hypothetical protein [Richelia sp.]CDN13023.1 hypothetical protein RintRC_1042 [Richelia intracellularis]